MRLSPFLEKKTGERVDISIISEAEKRNILLNKIGSLFPYPKIFHVVLHNRCNLKCVMCPYHSVRLRKTFKSDFFKGFKKLPLPVFKAIAQYAGKRNITIQLGQVEEPLLYDDVFDYINIAKESGVKFIHITTNGTTLTKEKSERLIDSGIDSVMVSLDSCDPDTYKKIRNYDLNKVENNARYLFNLAKSKEDKDIRTMVSFVRQPLNEGEREKFIEHWYGKNVNCISFYVLSDYDTKQGKIIRGKDNYEHGERYICSSPWQQSFILPDGNVSICCMSLLMLGWNVVSMGNLNNNSFGEIWDGPRYRKLREELIDNDFKKFPICNECGIWSASEYFTQNNKTYTRIYNETTDVIRFKA